MPTRRLPDIKQCNHCNHCNHPDHNPHSHRVFEPGRYEHECPKCGHVQYFTVRELSWGGKDGDVLMWQKYGSVKVGFGEPERFSSPYEIETSGEISGYG